MIVTPYLRELIPWLALQDGEHVDLPDKPWISILIHSKVNIIGWMIKHNNNELIDAIKTASYLFSPHLKILVEELTWRAGGQLNLWKYLFSFHSKVTSCFWNR